MKVIISRKGFDSGWGGSPSPIIEGEKIQSLPIPSITDKTNYKDINYDGNINLSTLMQRLNISPNIGVGNCHLDPDLDYYALNRPPKWRGVFGQDKAAQGHLRNSGVEEGDLFLFFGWFRKVTKEDGEYNFSIPSEDLHALFGYLMIDEVLKVGPNTKVPPWLHYHSHCLPHARNEKNNTLYIAKEEIEPGIPGYGVFSFSEKLILTKPGHPRSRWTLHEEIFKDLKITYHSKNSWKNGYFQSAQKGQEFVIEENHKVTKWAMELIREHAPSKVLKDVA